jgi:uroporphyrinogen-III synthase
MAPPPQPTTIPILLLKTKSTPTDAYEDLFTSPPSTETSTKSAVQDDVPNFAPQFVPVLQHRFLDAGLDRLRAPLLRQQISSQPDAEYGGLIFTSQRAVEAFAKIYAEDLGARAMHESSSQSLIKRSRLM